MPRKPTVTREVDGIEVSVTNPDKVLFPKAGHTKLALHQAGYLAQKRLARGLLLNHPEAVALIATQVLEFIREGRSVAELMDLGRQLEWAPV